MIPNESVVVLGAAGEIGQPILALSRGGYLEVLARDLKLPVPPRPQHPVAAIHVAIPGESTSIVEAVTAADREYHPRVVLVHSTTIPGTCDALAEKIGIDRVVHCQVHGKHKSDSMRRDMLRYPRFVATASDTAFEAAAGVLRAMGHPPDQIRRLSSLVTGELSKLLATSFFGYLIAWMQEGERMARCFDADLEELMSFRRIPSSDFVLDGKFPGRIGGHCVMPNLKILQKAHPSPLWDWIVASDDRTVEDIGGSR